MPDSTSKPKIRCNIHCIDPVIVTNATTRLAPSAITWIPYTCKISGAKENILILGDSLASELTASLTEAEDANSTRILAGLFSAELCECDVATLTGLPDQEVIQQLQRFQISGAVTHRKIYGMNYYRLSSSNARRIFIDLAVSSA